MKKEKISDVIGKLDESIVEEAAIYQKPKIHKRTAWIKWTAACAACLILFIGASLAIPHITNNGDNTHASSNTNPADKSYNDKLKDIRDGEDSAHNQQGVILPKIKVNNENLIQHFKRTNLKGFTAVNLIDGLYYGYKSTLSDSGLDDEFMLVNPQTGEEKKLKYSPDTVFEEGWVSSGSTVVMQDRYHYEWDSPTVQSTEQESYDVKLIKKDVRTGKVEVADEIRHGTPLIYLCKINDTEFLSFSLTQAPSDRTEYAVISDAWIYNVNGDKKRIIHEKYENNQSWSDSDGILIEHFTVTNGEICGLGRQLIAGEYKFFLYHYDKNGKLLKKDELKGFEKIIGSEQMIELQFVGDYIVFRTYETLTNYVCKRTSTGVELIAKGSYGSVLYAISGTDIFFIKTNVNPYTAEAERTSCPLYMIDTVTGNIVAGEISADMNEPYFVDFISLSDDTVSILFCENGTYDPMNKVQYTIKTDLLKEKISSASDFA